MLSNLTYLLYVLLINNLDRFIEQGTQNTGVPCFLPATSIKIGGTSKNL